MRFVDGRAAVADGMGHHGRDVAGRAAVAKMLAEPMRTGGAAAAEHLQRGSDVVERLQRGSAVAKCHQEDAACWGAGPPGRIAYAAGGKERKRITACRCE